MSGLFGSTTIKGNAITDFAKQTASVGNAIPFGYGKFVAIGQVIWTDDVVTHVTKKKQGKGGIKTEEYTYTRSYAIAFCAGPIYGYLTISRDGKIVYTTDLNAKVEDKDFAAKWAQKVALYFGTRTQMPDSTIEAKEGAGEVSAFRDLAYIVIENDDVTNGGGAIPNYQAVVVATKPDIYVTSRPYPIDVTEVFTGDGNLSSGRLWYQPFPLDLVSGSGQMLGGSLFVSSISASAPFEQFMGSGQMLGGSLFVSSISASAPFEQFMGSGQMLGGSLFVSSISYDSKPESISGSGSLTGGTFA